MKWFLSIVVVLNLLVFAYGQLKPSAQDSIPSPEIHADKIRLLPANWIAPPPGTSSEPLQQVASAPETAASEPEPEKPVALCFQWGKLNERLLARVKGGLPGLRLNQSQIGEATTEEKPRTQYLVYYPAMPSVDETNQMAMDLAASGFPSTVISEQGRGLSLGLFSEENNAKRLERRVRNAGFDRVKIEERADNTQKNSTTLLSFNQLNEEQAKKLKALQQHLTPGIRVKEVPCDNAPVRP